MSDQSEITTDDDIDDEGTEFKLTIKKPKGGLTADEIMIELEMFIKEFNEMADNEAALDLH